MHVCETSLGPRGKSLSHFSNVIFPCGIVSYPRTCIGVLIDLFAIKGEVIRLVMAHTRCTWIVFDFVCPIKRFVNEEARMLSKYVKSDSAGENHLEKVMKIFPEDQAFTNFDSSRASYYSSIRTQKHMTIYKFSIIVIFLYTLLWSSPSFF